MTPAIAIETIVADGWEGLSGRWECSNYLVLNTQRQERHGGTSGAFYTFSIATNKLESTRINGIPERTL